MGDEDAGQLAYFEVTPKNLVLSAFTAVKQPKFCSLG
jgi:hypothetical protein